MAWAAAAETPNDAAADLLATLEKKPELARFLELVKKSQLEDFFQTAENITVFAPLNGAIENLPAHLKRYYLSDNAKSRRRLRDQIRYTVLPVLLYTKDMRNGEVATVHGSDAYLEVMEDRGVQIDGARLVDADVTASNGVIHVIDQMIFSNVWK